MITRIAKLCSTAAVSLLMASSFPGIASADSAVQRVPESGIIKVKSAYPMAETIARLKKDVADKDLSEMTEDELKKLNVINRRRHRPLLEQSL